MKPVSAVLLALLLIAAVAFWLWPGRKHTAVVPAGAPVTPPARATVVPAAMTTPALSPPGYRLAGVAVGDPDSFAVVESPSGASALYHLDEPIPGLGRLVRIEAEQVVVESKAKRMVLWLRPAATPTPTQSLPPATRPRRTRPTVPPRSRSAGGGTGPELAPSAAPGSPAS